MDIEKARAYLSHIDLKGTRRNIVAQDATTDAGEVFEKAKTQAQIVGSGVFSFAQGVDATVREAISDSALLAQLVANKKAGAVEADPLKWFQEYAELLQNVGWVLQDAGWTDYSEKGKAAEVHTQIIEVMTAALAPGATAVAIVKATLEALQAMNKDNPWITLFSRESQRAKVARFQIGLVTQDPNGDVFVQLIACLIEAKNTITQVLFFKYKEAKARFRASSQKVTIDRAALADLSGDIRRMVRVYQHDYVSTIGDLLTKP